MAARLLLLLLGVECDVCQLLFDLPYRLEIRRPVEGIPPARHRPRVHAGQILSNSTAMLGEQPLLKQGKNQGIFGAKQSNTIKVLRPIFRGEAFAIGISQDCGACAEKLRESGQISPEP
jgi:hypothetical protein